MDINIHPASATNEYAFVLGIDAESYFWGGSIKDMAYLSLQQVSMKRKSFWDKFPGGYPVLLELHGALFTGGSYANIGATLQPPNNLPLEFNNTDERFISLVFSCPRSYIQYLEEERTRQPRQPLTLGITLTGIVAVVAEKQPSINDTATLPRQPYRSASSKPIEIIYLETISVYQNQSISISRSKWTDLLPTLGYPNRRFIELPALEPDKMDEQLREAATHVNEAHSLFTQERYREAVQRCRQARDALVGASRTTWAQDTLASVIGNEKAAMIDDGIKALNRLGNVASHANPLEVDRETANYVIASLTQILHYIDCKLK